jgi:hypothetical protein
MPRWAEPLREEGRLSRPTTKLPFCYCKVCVLQNAVPIRSHTMRSEQLAHPPCGRFRHGRLLLRPVPVRLVGEAYQLIGRIIRGNLDRAGGFHIPQQLVPLLHDRPIVRGRSAARRSSRTSLRSNRRAGASASIFTARSISRAGKPG